MVTPAGAWREEYSCAHATVAVVVAGPLLANEPSFVEVDVKEAGEEPAASASLLNEGSELSYKTLIF